MKKHLLPGQRSAFSLIELVVVIAIIAIIATFTVPAATTILRGSAITQASQTLTDQISLARQMALSRNRAVEVRFYQYADPEAPGETVGDQSTWKYRAIQLFEIVESGVAIPLDKPQRLPVSVVIEPNIAFSTLIPATPTKPAATDPDLPRGIIKPNYRYASFRFLQDGSTNLAPTSTWFVSIHNLTDTPTGTTMKKANGDPINFFTLQIDPVSGAIKGFRPTAA